MSGPAATASLPPSRGVATGVVLALALAGLGLVGDLPIYFGPFLGVAGAALSALWRRRRRQASGALELLPALSVLALLALAAPAGPASELFAPLGGLALLLWVADDPLRPAGGPRRALPTVLPAALASALAWALVLELAGRAGNLALAAVVVAAALVLLAVLLADVSSGTLASGETLRR